MHRANERTEFSLRPVPRPLKRLLGSDFTISIVPLNKPSNPTLPSTRVLAAYWMNVRTRKTSDAKTCDSPQRNFLLAQPNHPSSGACFQLSFLHPPVATTAEGVNANATQTTHCGLPTDTVRSPHCILRTQVSDVFFIDQPKRTGLFATAI